LRAAGVSANESGGAAAIKFSAAAGKKTSLRTAQYSTTVIATHFDNRTLTQAASTADQGFAHAGSIAGAYRKRYGMEFRYAHAIKTVDESTLPTRAHPRKRVSMRYIMTLHERSATRNANPARQQDNIRLTRRQQEILSWVAEGKTNWEISIIMRCKEVTVNYHMKRIFTRLCATNKAHAVSKAMRLGLLAPSACSGEVGTVSSSRSGTNQQ